MLVERPHAVHCEARVHLRYGAANSGNRVFRGNSTAHVGVEWLWLERWRGRSPRVLLPPEEFPTLAAVCARWEAVEHEMMRYLATLPEGVLEEPMTCVGTRGNTWTYSLWRMMVHLLEHQTYHRGQVTSLLRQLGLEPPKVDFLDGQDAGLGRGRPSEKA